MTGTGTQLWHFTCAHAHSSIGRRGVLTPHAHPLMSGLGPVVWLTSDPTPDRDDIGLTSRILACDRMAYRYRAVDPDLVHPWSEVAEFDDLVPTRVRAGLEASTRPETWWLSTVPVEAVLA